MAGTNLQQNEMRLFSGFKINIPDCFIEPDFYSVHVSDRFSDLGLVGAFAVKDTELALFSLSCRALGREIENTMLEYILSNWKIKSVDFYSTGKNADFKTVLEEKIHPVFVEKNMVCNN